jgi:hypothetical protein
MRVLKVTRNDEVQWIIGIDSPLWSAMVLIEYRRDGEKWRTRLHGTGTDDIREEHSSWPNGYLKLSDVVNIQLLDADATMITECSPSTALIDDVVEVANLPDESLGKQSAMCAVLIEVNGTRVRLAGTRGDKWSIVATVYWRQNSVADLLMLDVVVLDETRKVTGTWPSMDINPNDVVSIRLVQTEQGDPFGIESATITL